MNKEIVLDALNECKRLQKINAELLEALNRVNNTISLYGKMDRNTDLHEFIMGVIENAETKPIKK